MAALGSIPCQRSLSEDQFVGDLMGLFQRRRIRVGEPCAVEQFESSFETKEAFRNQVFTMCMAISHLAVEDLSGEQLFDLVVRALSPSGASSSSDGAVPDRLKSAFLNGYQAWSNRDLSGALDWPFGEQPTRNGDSESTAEPRPNMPDPEPTEVYAPGQRTVQKALDIARQNAPPTEEQLQRQQSLGIDIQGMTLNELTKLLEEIEGRMSRIRPQVRKLGSAEHSPEAPTGLSTLGNGNNGSGQPHQPAVGLPERGGGSVIDWPSLGYVLASTDGDPLISASAEDDAFLKRHPYLRPGRRVPIQVLSPDPGIPLNLHVEECPLPPPGPLIYRTPPLETSPEPKPVSGESLVPLAIALAILTALVMVAIWMGGILVYRSMHPVYRYDNLQPASHATPGTTPSAGSFSRWISLH